MLKAKAERWDKCAVLFIISAFSLFVGMFVLQCKSRYNLFTDSSVCVFPGNQAHDFGVASGSEAGCP